MSNKPTVVFSWMIIHDDNSISSAPTDSQIRRSTTVIVTNSKKTFSAGFSGPYFLTNRKECLKKFAEGRDKYYMAVRSTKLTK